MIPSLHVALTEARSASPPTARHPTDQDALIEVTHDEGVTVRAETPDASLPGRLREDTTSRITVPQTDLWNAMGRYPIQIQGSDGSTATAVLDLLTPRHQAERFRELIDALTSTPLAALALTSISPNEGPGNEPTSPERLEEATQLLLEAVTLLRRNPPTRVRARMRDTTLAESMSGSTLMALATQPYALTPTSPNAHSLPIQGRHYRGGVIHAPSRSETTDTPEMQFVHGVTHAVTRSTQLTIERLEHELENLPLAVDSDETLEGYVPLARLTARQARQTLTRRAGQAHETLARLGKIRRTLHQQLPVRRGTLQVPHTPRLATDPRYRRVRHALDILQQGAKHTSGLDGFIASINSLATLYELYCLGRIHQSLLHLGYEHTSTEHDARSGTYDGPHTLNDGSPFPNRFRYEHDTLGSAILHYEPRITREAHDTAHLACNAANSSFLTPDFVLTSSRGILIFDAKLAGDTPVHYLPDLTLKYLHGLEPCHAHQPIRGLHLLHYSDRSDAFDYHQRPVTPSIGTTPVHPRRPEALTHLLRTSLNAALEI